MHSSSQNTHHMTQYSHRYIYGVCGAILGVFFVPFFAFASDIEIYPTEVDVGNGASWLGNEIADLVGFSSGKYRIYTGTYPSGTIREQGEGFYTGTEFYLEFSFGSVYGDGDYWRSWSNDDFSTTYYARATRTGGVWSYPQSPSELVLNYIKVEGGDEITTASTTFDISVTSSLAGSFDFELTLKQYAISGGISTTTINSYTQSGTITREYTFILPEGTTWNVTARALDFFTGDLYTDTAILHVVSPSGEWLFRGETWQDIECSISNLTGCFKKALYWAFVPSSSIGSEFLGLWNEIKTKPPIGYITLSAELLSGMSEGEGDFVLETITPIQDNIFTPFKNATTTVFFVLAGFYIFKRSTNFVI